MLNATRIGRHCAANTVDEAIPAGQATMPAGGVHQPAHAPKHSAARRTEGAHAKPDFAEKANDASATDDTRLHMENARKPTGEYGEQVLQNMNVHHEQMASWAFSHITLSPYAHVLDIGCGGGANLERLCRMCPNGLVEGLDYSDVSVRLSTERNQEAVDEGRCVVRKGNVDELPYASETFDAVVACETVYFWPNLTEDLAEVRRVLGYGGKLLVIGEMTDPDDPMVADNADIITVYRPGQLADLIHDAGFNTIELHTTDSQYCIVATNK
jgi:ubiquinone/menaquinone biosynthesis C-methylase UbiE